MIVWSLPLKTVSEINNVKVKSKDGKSRSEHWTEKSKRHKQQQFFIRSLFNHEGIEIKLPCTVKLIRISPRLLDDDNLRSAFKWIRDELSECLIPEKVKAYVTKKGKMALIKGRADDDPRITWIYDQEKGKQGIRIEILTDFDLE